MADAKQRKREPALTARDGAALGWVGEQYAVRVDVLSVVLGRLSPVPGRRPQPLSYRAVRDVLDRWERSRLAVRRSMLGAMWAVPTERGLRFGGLDYEPWMPKHHRLRHVHAAAVVRLAFEARGLAWQGERFLRAERARAREAGGWSKWRAPDAVVLPPPGTEPSRFEIEVELEQKADHYLRQVLTARTTAGASVVYFCPPELLDTVRTQLARVLAEVRGQPFAPERVEAWQLPEIPGASYEGRW
jgi:hypothetical protein